MDENAQSAPIEQGQLRMWSTTAYIRRQGKVFMITTRIKKDSTGREGWHFIDSGVEDWHYDNFLMYHSVLISKAATSVDEAR